MTDKNELFTKNETDIDTIETDMDTICQLHVVVPVNRGIIDRNEFRVIGVVGKSLEPEGWSDWFLGLFGLAWKKECEYCNGQHASRLKAEEFHE